MRHLLIFIELILLQSLLDTMRNLTGYGTGMVIVFCQTQRWRRILGWNFLQQIWVSRKEKMFNPIHQAALVSHQCPALVRIFIVKAHWPSSSSAPPLCPTDPKFCVLLLKSSWILGSHPFLLEPNLSGADESEDILKERQWEFLLWKPGLIEVFFSLRHAEQIKIKALCSLKIDEFFQNMPKWSTLYFFLIPNQSRTSKFVKEINTKERKEGFLFNRVLKSLKCFSTLKSDRWFQKWDLMWLTFWSKFQNGI